jgi:hypothetical protein
MSSTITAAAATERMPQASQCMITFTCTTRYFTSTPDRDKKTADAMSAALELHHLLLRALR